jgi:hypothetical protein
MSEIFELRKPAVFVIAGAHQDFEARRGAATWFKSTTRPGSVRAARVEVDLLYETGAGGQVCLGEGGCLVEDVGSGRVSCVSFEQFTATYSRCFADGRIICRLDESLYSQAMALQREARGLRERACEAMDVTVIDSLWELLSATGRRRSVQRGAEVALELSNVLNAHSRDVMRLREFSKRPRV